MNRSKFSRWRFVVAASFALILPWPASGQNPSRTNSPRADIVIEDFEGSNYGSWKVEGNAWGTGPASPIRVVGFEGKQLVNSYRNGNTSTGTLTSAPFKIERPNIKFLIGGGSHKGSTCVELLVEGKTVRSQTGNQRKDSVGRMILEWKAWDVSEFLGKEAVIRIVDNHRGQWGCIIADQFVQSDDPTTPPFKDIGYTSIIPFYRFGKTIEEQEAQLKENPQLKSFQQSRKAMEADPLLPIYHFTSPEGRTNDPNGLCFWNGKWHLFYQAYPPADPRQHWGHAVSEDLLRWKDLPYAIYPNPEECVFSGTAEVDGNRVIVMYLGTKVGEMVATSEDPLLLNWEKVSGKAVIPYPEKSKKITGKATGGLPYSVYDPCIWKEGDTYYALLGGWIPEGPDKKRIRRLTLHRSKDLINWEYLHPFLEKDFYTNLGDDAACPYFWPIGDRYILFLFSHMSGGSYLIGDYDKNRRKFVVGDGGDFNFGPVHPGGLHAPAAFPDGKGNVIAIFNMNEGIPQNIPGGWSGIMTLPRRLWLEKDDPYAPLRMEPAVDTRPLRYGHQSVADMKLPANKTVVLKDIKGNAFELQAEIDCSKSQMLELNVLHSPNEEEVTRIVFYPQRGYTYRRYTDKRGLQYSSAISIDTSRSSTRKNAKSRLPETAPVYLAEGETLKLHVFVDKSVVEVFVNGKQCVSIRAYPERGDSLGISLRSQGNDACLKKLDFWQMKSIYE